MYIHSNDIEQVGSKDKRATKQISPASSLSMTYTNISDLKCDVFISSSATGGGPIDHNTKDVEEGEGIADGHGRIPSSADVLNSRGAQPS